MPNESHKEIDNTSSGNYPHIATTRGRGRRGRATLRGAGEQSMQHGELAEVQSGQGSMATASSLTTLDDGDQAWVAAAKRRTTWARLRRRRLAMAALLVIGLFVVAAILAPLLAPHN